MSYLFGVVLVKLCLASITPPKAKDFGLRAVSHVYNTFEPPAFHDRTTDCSQYESILTHFHES